MFNKIAKKYDLANKVLSFGVDRGWRKKLAKLVGRKPDAEVLDLATGTGDVIVDLLRYATPKRIVGIDPSQGMLNVAKEKISDANTRLDVGDAQNLKLKDEEFDFVTISFGIRNVPNTIKALKEMYRVLRPGGEALILEFSIPTNWFVRMKYMFYLRYILPVLGGMITGDKSAYKYLNETIESFPHGAEFGKLLKDAGFDDVIYHKMTFGIATIYQAKKL